MVVVSVVVVYIGGLVVGFLGMGLVKGSVVYIMVFVGIVVVVLVVGSFVVNVFIFLKVFDVFFNSGSSMIWNSIIGI